MYTFVEKDENISGACTNFLRGGGIRKSSVPDTTVLDTLGDLRNQEYNRPYKILQYSTR